VSHPLLTRHPPGSFPTRTLSPPCSTVDYTVVYTTSNAKKYKVKRNADLDPPFCARTVNGDEVTLKCSLKRGEAHGLELEADDGNDNGGSSATGGLAGWRRASRRLLRGLCGLLIAA
jgi:hypothetical protein